MKLACYRTDGTDAAMILGYDVPVPVSEMPDVADAPAFLTPPALA